MCSTECFVWSVNDAIFTYGWRKKTRPATTPGDIDLAALVERRLTKVGPDGLMFPSPGGQWARRSNYGRNLFDPKTMQDEGFTYISIGRPAIHPVHQVELAAPASA